MIAKLKYDNLWTFFNKKALPKPTSGGQITREGTQTRRDTPTASPAERPSRKGTANRVSAVRLRGESGYVRAASGGNLLEKQSWSKFRIS